VKTTANNLNPIVPLWLTFLSPSHSIDVTFIYGARTHNNEMVTGTAQLAQLYVLAKGPSLSRIWGRWGGEHFWECGLHQTLVPGITFQLLFIVAYNLKYALSLVETITFVFF